LFEHIAAQGRLEEEEAVKFFRQMLSAVGYCHSINICHRDLKPENILLNSSGDIKIADFGMAALHQSPGYKLKTSCGSPHYAAPELVKGEKYRGDKADIWSLGVILFAMLAGRLPFDVDAPADRDWIPVLLAKIKRGQYQMESHFSPEAQNLVSRILQINPRDRITMDQLWKHPLIRKYDYLDDLRRKLPTSPALKDCSRRVARRSDIDRELMRHLRSMWHTLSEEQLIQTLLSDT
jgi:serine/threonine protein kinase